MNRAKDSKTAADSAAGDLVGDNFIVQMGMPASKVMDVNPVGVCEWTCAQPRSVGKKGREALKERLDKRTRVGL